MPDVEEAIERGEFHLYTMENLDDAIETLILNDNETIEDFYKSVNEELNKYKDKKN